jgi:Nuclease-related domain
MAWWYRDDRRIVCTACQPTDPLPAARAATQTPPQPLDQRETASANLAHPDTPVADAAPSVEPLTVDGEAGSSARREGVRRAAKRERQMMNAHPRLGKLILAMSDEPQSVRSWGKGAVGEETLGAKLNKFASERCVILHDRRIPGSRANIDHLANTPAGVFVIDAKHYAGEVQKQDLGGWFRTDIRLYVGRRDCTKLLHGSEDQGEVVRDALAPLGFTDIPVRPVLCFVGAEWGLFAKPFKVGSVLITYPKSLYELLRQDGEVETAAIQETARQIAQSLPRA